MAEEREADGEGRERPSTSADRRGRRSGPAPAGAGEGKGRSTAVRDGRQAKSSPLSRLSRFIREVVAELRKVIWPSRRQMITYTFVVLVFVSFMVALVAGMDYVFAQGVLFLFGT